MDNFSLNQLPFPTLEMVGMTKDKILSLDKHNLKRLFTGKRTDVMRFDFYTNGRRIIFDGKLLLQQNGDKIQASIVPVRKQIQNDFDLDNNELIKLYTGKLINKNIDGQRHLLQLDRDTNEIIRAKTAHIRFPFDVGKKDREKLLNGKSVDIQTSEGIRKVRIDLLNDRGFSFDGEISRIRYFGTHFNETDLQTVNIEQFNLNEYEKQRLMDGFNTGLVELPDGSKAKIGLDRADDKTVFMQIYPVKNEINNDIHLNQQQLEKLKLGETVVTELNGKLFLCQLDKETNELLRREMEHVVPDVIRGISLKQEDKDRLVNGQSITLINNQTGEYLTARIELNHKQGIELKDDISKLKILYNAGENVNRELEKLFPNRIERDKFLGRNNLQHSDLANSARAAFDERQKFYFDYHNPGVVGFIKTDLNRAEYMEFFQSQHVAVNLKM